jgi:hypothetical protein
MRTLRRSEADTPSGPCSRFPDVDGAFQDLLARVDSATHGFDPASAQALLHALLGMQERFARCVDSAARRAHDHLSWEAIGRIAGVTKQAAHHRWGRGDESTEGLAG